MSNEKEIRDLFAKHNCQLSQDDVWTVQKVQVVKHKALERLSAAMGIKWAAPIVLRAQMNEAVILATGEANGASEWSIGEALVVPMLDTGRKNQWGKPIFEPADGSIGNYQITPKQAAYPFAMAEKRAKDRVIIKLAGLHGVYSEDEADEFKDEKPPAVTTRGGPPNPPQSVKNVVRPLSVHESETVMETLRTALICCTTFKDIDEWYDQNETTIRRISQTDYDALMVDRAKHIETLKQKKVA